MLTHGMIYKPATVFFVDSVKLEFRILKEMKTDLIKQPNRRDQTATVGNYGAIS